MSKIVIERPHKKCRVTIHSARPGVESSAKRARHRKAAKVGGQAHRQRCGHQHRRNPQARTRRAAGRRIDREQLERRVPFRRAMKRAVQSAMRLGAEGIRINSRAASAAPKSRAWNGTARAACRCTRARRRRLRRCHRFHRLRHLRREGLDIQGRNPRTRSDGAGQEAGRRRPGPSAPRRAPRSGGKRV